MTDWKWWAGNNEEFFTDGPFDSRDEAISEYKGNWDPEGGFHIVEAVSGKIEFSANRLIDNQYFDNEDLFSFEGAGPDRLAGAEEADKELQELLNQWVEKYRGTFVTPTMFRGQRNAEYIESDAKP